MLDGFNGFYEVSMEIYIGPSVFRFFPRQIPFIKMMFEKNGNGLNICEKTEFSGKHRKNGNSHFEKRNLL